MNKKAYAAINLNDDVRKISSSGGIFYEIAKLIIADKGIVFGAAFDRFWNVTHTHAETLEDTVAFLGSKYVQSNMKNEYRLVSDCLKSGRRVLFSGTPCQISGLKTYLGRDYENLVTVDFICHGVPSPSVYRKYLKKKLNGSTIKSINFREKAEGWRNFSLKIEFTDDTIYRENQHTDLYMKGFLQDIFLRPSCYACNFKGLERSADFTLADFWGVHNILPDMFDDKGTSLVFIHSEEGKKIWEELSTKLSSCEVNINNVLKCNSNAFKSAPKTNKRDKFYQRENFEQLERLTQKSLAQKVQHVLFKIVGRIR